MARITDESKEIIEHCVQKGYLDGKIYASLWKANNKNEIVKCLREQLSLNDITTPRFWTLIIQTIWTNFDDIFDKKEILLLKEILNNYGVLLRNDAREGSLNEYMITKAMQGLEDRGIIYVLHLTSNERLFLINPKITTKLFKDKNG